MHSESPFIHQIVRLPGCGVRSGLYLVATPIGHSADISLRAIATLAQVDLIACEDSRVTGKLLQAYDVKTKLILYHEHNAEKARPEIIKHIKEGKSVALVSDAGMPLISDPGYKLVKACYDHDLYVSVIPGATAVTTALALSGLPTNTFLFGGFIPSKSSERKSFLKKYTPYPETLIFFDSPHRITKTLEDMTEPFTNRQIAVCRELTKKFEEVVRGTPEEVLNHFLENSPRGEFVIVVEGNTAPALKTDAWQAIALEMIKTESINTVSKQIALEYGLKKKEVYEHLLSKK